MKYRVLGFLCRPVDLRFSKTKLLCSNILSDAEKTLLRKTSLKVNSKDGLYMSYKAGYYLSVGLSAARSVEESLKAIGKTRQIRFILDFACGYGRVLRFLRAMFPESLIIASEIDMAALTFCKKHFSAETFLSKTNFRELQLSQKFDLIWCGSLITHIDERNAADLLKFFYDHLLPGGLCVFTTHGQRSIDWIKNKKDPYGFTGSDRQKILHQFHEKGYGYVDYKGQHGYGLSFVSHDRMLAIAKSVGQWKETYYREHGWDEHQDVYSFEIPLPSQ